MPQPPGQRVVDLVAWTWQVLDRYERDVEVLTS